LADAWLVIEATVPARAVSRRGAWLAAAGTTVGAVWAAIGPDRGAAQRAQLGVNGAALVALADGHLAGLTVRRRRPPGSSPSHRWHALDTEEVLRLVDSAPTGLEPEEQARRPRATTSPPSQRTLVPSIGRATWKELANPLTPVLAIGAGLSAATGSMADATLVGTVSAANALISGAQRVLADRAIATLGSSCTVPVRVRHGDTVEEQVSGELVVGDVIELDAGDVVPGDARVLDALRLEVDESTLSGESLPGSKHPPPVPGVDLADRTSMLFAGTPVAVGTGSAVIVATGDSTEMGRVVADLGTPPPSGVEQRLARITRITVPVTVAAG